MSVLFAYDYSGSTGGSKFYHEWSQKLYQAAVATDGAESITILLWDNAYQVVTPEKLKEINDRLTSHGGTSPSCVATYIKKNDFHGKLILVTDGQVGTGDVDQATAELGTEWSFTSVEAHLINTGGVVNMSVSCPFTRNCPHVVREYNYGREIQMSVVVSPEDLAAIHQVASINTVEEYLTVQNAIEKVVQARTMGTTGDPSLRDSILEMKKRIMNGQARQFGKSNNVDSLVQTVQESAEVADADADAVADKAVQFADAVTKEFFAVNLGWAGSIDKLVGMCDGALRGAFDLGNIAAAIEGDRARRAELAEQADAGDAPLTDGAAKFDCPITLDTEADVLLFVAEEGAPVLAGLDKSIVNYLSDCPLNALSNPDVVAKIKAKLDHPISLKAAQEAIANGAPITKSPMTQRTVIGGIALGCSAEHVKCTTSVIAKMISEGKLLGNPDLWFAVIWRLVETDQIPYLSHLKEQFRAQMLWRCKNNKCSLSMTGLPELPTTRVPLGVAAWYVFAASALSLTGKREPIRAHLTHIEPLASIVELTGYKVPSGANAHIARLRTMLGMLNNIKKDRDRIPALAKAFVQNSIIINTSNIGDDVKALEKVVQTILVDGPATQSSIDAARLSMPNIWRSLSNKEFVALSSLVDPSLSAGDVSLPYNFAEIADAKWEEVAASGATVGWQYGTDSTRAVATVRICPNTCRPYYTPVKGIDKTWRNEAEVFYGFPAAEQFPVNRYFGDFVAKYRKYPNYEELLTFAYNRVLNSDAGRTTLPCVAHSLVLMALEAHKPVMAQHTPVEFRRKYLDTFELKDRKPVEEKE